MKNVFVFEVVDAENVFHMFIWVHFCSMYDLNIYLFSIELTF